jgi:hypothetical protein
VKTFNFYLMALLPEKIRGRASVGSKLTPRLILIYLAGLVFIPGCLSIRVAGIPPTKLPPQATAAGLRSVAKPTSTPTTLSSPTSMRTATLQPIVTPSPTGMPTSRPDPTPTPALLPSLRQLTAGGCCVQPFFSPDSRLVLFIDKASQDAPVGIYGVDVTGPASTGERDHKVKLIYETIGFRSPDHTVVARPDAADGSKMRFAEEVSGRSWLVDTYGEWPVFSADGQQIYWNVTDRRGPYDERRTDIWVANVDGSNSRRVMTVYGGGAEAWFPNGQHILLVGRENKIGEEEALVVLSLADGSTLELAREKRLRGGLVSPGGSWVVYFVTFSDDPERDGLWAIRANGTERHKLDFFGPYRWRDDTHLIYIPTRESPKDSLVVWELDVESGHSRPLTDPQRLRFIINDGDWELSPDGKKLVFVSAEDKNFWLITLP